MKVLNLTKTKFLLFLIILLGIISITNAQEVPFSPRLSDGTNAYINIKGDYTFLANGILNRRDDSNTANDVYNGGSNNNGFHREYIDIDGDDTTFSSSSSTLSFPDCSQIYYAGLYWGGNYNRDVVNSRYTSDLPNDNNRYDYTAIKFKMPGGNYIDLVADNNPDPVGEEDDIIIDGVGTVKDHPYVCYKNVTSQLQGLADAQGEYFVANVRGTRGKTVYGAAGWTLVIIYENPTLPGRYFSIFDGYEGVSKTTTADFGVAGFNTIPAGPVKARLGVSVLEGDRGITGDRFRIRSGTNGFTDLSNASNPANNFFNSNITIDGADVTTRNINSENTLGYGADIFNIDNPLNSIIANDATTATLQLQTSGDGFGAFLVTFGIDIIEPDIVLEKKVEDIAGNDITGQGVNLGQTLEYVLSFKNIGNDDATEYSIRDVLPLNVTLDESNFSLPPGVTYTFDSLTGTVTFSIPDNLIEEGDPISSIRMRVEVAENCFDFVDACTDQIRNIAFSTYQGIINDNVISDDPSVTDFDDCGFTTPGATNFLLDDLSDCNFNRTVEICGTTTTLNAGNGFDDYIWYRDVNENLVIDSGDTVLDDQNPDNDLSTLIVEDAGIYIVDKIVADPCKGFKEIITVERFGTTPTNPIITLFNENNSDADPSNDIQGEILTCSIDGGELPNIFLCGANDTQFLQVNITDAVITWEQLNETNCTATNNGCANKSNSPSCWTSVSSGNSYTADTPGEYRLSINYTNGCISRFNFNIFQNNLDIEYTKRDKICDTPGNITITNLGSGYGYQLINIVDDSVEVPFSAKCRNYTIRCFRYSNTKFLFI